MLPVPEVPQCEALTLLAFFGDRTGAFAGVATAGLDLPEGGHQSPAEEIGFVLLFRGSLEDCLPDSGSRVATPTQARLRPEGRGNQVRVDTEPAPPCDFIAAAVDLAMVKPPQQAGQRPPPF
jgi:hypothetical protein